jgi:hyperosmotically inducible periplasmic protein
MFFTFISHKESRMTTLKRIAIACLAVTALIGTTYASAQTDSGTVDSSSQSPKKVIRAQNRQLAKTVRRALTQEKHLTSSGITVLARGGVVTLDGTVPTNDEVQVATDVASNVPGVRSVTNNLLMQEEGH